MLRTATVLLITLGAVPAAAQVADSAQTCIAHTAAGLPGVAGLRDDYIRALSLRSNRPANVLIRRPSHRGYPVEVPCDELWRSVISTTDTTERTAVLAGFFDAVYNSGYPRGNHTGLLWPGRGLDLMWTAGAEYRVGPLHFGLYPQIAFQQNRAFGFVPFPGDSGSDYAYPWARSVGGQPRIDWPQRHGEDGFWSASLGQSFVAIEQAGVRAGVSSENVWWGPAVRNSILLGNEAPGFPHAFVATPQGIRTPIGDFAAELIWARLTESDYFNTDSEDDHRFLSGFTLSFQPRAFTGLGIGAARLYYQPYKDLGVADLVPFLESPLKTDPVTPENPSGENEADEMLGLYARYAVPRTGFEIYGEWARNARSNSIRDLAVEPDHSRAYTLGFQQIVPHGARWYRLRGEFTQMNGSRTSAHRPSARYYIHHLVRQGYTHQGQLLGASIGPGADAQFLGFDVFLRQGSHGLFFERVRYDEDAFYMYVSPIYGGWAHDVELTGGTSHLLRLGPVDVSIGISYSSRQNRGFRYCNPMATVILDCRTAAARDHNWHVPLGVAWRMN